MDGWMEQRRDGWRDLLIPLFLTSIQEWKDKRMDGWVEQGRGINGAMEGMEQGRDGGREQGREEWIDR